MSSKLQSLETESGSDIQDSSPVASETSYVDSSDEDDCDDIGSGMLHGNAMDSAPCSGLSSVASSAPVAERRTWAVCLHFDKRLHGKEVIDDHIRFFLAIDLKIALHSLLMVDRAVSEQWGGWSEREVSRVVFFGAFAKG